MIRGTLIMEDTVLDFELGDCKPGRITVMDLPSGKSDTRTADNRAICKALAIAIHPDGTPDHNLDYDEAESIQPADRDLRWIP